MDRTPYSFALLLSLCLCVTGRPGPGEEPITCKTSGIVLEGTSAEVTCDFHNDLNNTDGSFYVYRQTESEAVITAICKWRGGDPECRLVDNCAFKAASLDGKVTFVIPSVEERHSGEYTCKTLPAHEANARNCRLIVEKNTIMSDHPVSCLASSPAKLGDDASVFCMFPTTIGMTGVTLWKSSPKNGEMEEVVRCEKDKGCSVAKDGYWVDAKTDTYLRVSIPDITEDKAGLYSCRPTYIQQESGVCKLEVQDQGDGNTKMSVLTNITVPLYAILGCFVILLLIGVVALLQSSCFLSRFPRTQDQGESQESLMPEKKAMHAG